MDILFHTIALEPARWTPKRVSQSLPDLLGPIAAHGFTQLEIYEPHLADAAQWEEIKGGLEAHGLTAVILSSYANFAALSDEQAAEAFTRIEDLINFFGFRAVRLFPGPNIDPEDAAAVGAFAEKLRAVASRLPATQILLETHDHSIADNPERIVEVVQALDLANVGLLYQPTTFDNVTAQAQFDLQRPLIRHVHLQNRNPENRFALLGEGTVRWERILKDLPAHGSATIEFVPRGICPEAEFDLKATLQEAQSEKAWVESLV